MDGLQVKKLPSGSWQVVSRRADLPSLEEGILWKRLDEPIPEEELDNVAQQLYELIHGFYDDVEDGPQYWVAVTPLDEACVEVHAWELTTGRKGLPDLLFHVKRTKYDTPLFPDLHERVSAILIRPLNLRSRDYLDHARFYQHRFGDEIIYGYTPGGRIYVDRTRAA